MPNIIIRGFSEEDRERLKEVARQAEYPSLNAWAVEGLLYLADHPDLVVATWNRYRIWAQGPGPAYVEIKRVDDTMNDTNIWLSEEQTAAYLKAVKAVKRNDRLAAREVLKTAFERVGQQRLE